MTSGSQGGSFQWLGLAIGCAAIAISLWFGFNVGKRFQLRGIPGPKPTFLFGNLLDGPLETFHKNFVAWPQKYGSMMRYFLGHNAYILCSDPDLIYQISVKHFTSFQHRTLPLYPSTGTEDDDRRKWDLLWSSQGKFWSTIRSATTMLFHAKSLASYNELMDDAIQQFTVRIQKEAQSGEGVEVAAMLRAMSLQIIGSAAFGVDFAPGDKASLELGKRAMHLLHPKSFPTWLRLLLVTFPFLRTPLNFFLKHFTSDKSEIAPFLEANGYLTGASKALLQNTKASQGQVREHILPSQLATQKGEKPNSGRIIQLRAQDHGYTEFQDAAAKTDSFFHKLSQATFTQDGSELHLTDSQIIPQAIVFILAGFDTTATNLAFTLFEVAKHPEIQARIKAEIDRFYDEHGESTQLENSHLPLFPYTQACLLESLRMHPPIHPQYIQQRTALSTTKIGQWTIPAGVTVVLNTHGLSRNADLFPNPEVFMPERFLKENDGCLSVEQPSSFLSFGAGPHKCIGYKFAIQEGVFALLEFHRKFHYRLDETHHGMPQKMEYSPGLVFAPKDGVWLKIANYAED